MSWSICGIKEVCVETCTRLTSFSIFIHHFQVNVTSEILEFKHWKTVLSVILYSYGSWSRTWREEHELWIYQNVLRNIFGPRRSKVGSEGYHMRNFMITSAIIISSVVLYSCEHVLLWRNIYLNLSKLGLEQIT
jgi:hypothetical protein